jgi:hypothetical protein
VNKIKIPKDLCIEFERMGETKRVFMEGNILKVIEPIDYEEFNTYIEKSKAQDASNRRKRLEVTKQVQDQNKQLIESYNKNKELMEDLKGALKSAEDAKVSAENDLDLMQKKRQFELIGNIVNYALYVILGTGIITTALYAMAILYQSSETTLIGNTWSNLFGILLTNSFSIIGTIMGVKYASDSKKETTPTETT